MAIMFIGQVSVSAQASGLHARIDERIELAGVCRYIAGERNLCMCEPKEYVEDIEEYFAPYKNHPLIGFLKGKKNSLPAAATLVSAMMTEIDGGYVRVNDDCNVESKELLYTVWDRRSHDEYMRLLDDFYRKSRFRRFYERHKAMYEDVVATFDKMYDIDTGWFEDTYGVPFVTISVFINMTGGFNSYELPFTGDAVIGGFFYCIGKNTGNLSMARRSCLMTGDAKRIIVKAITRELLSDDIKCGGEAVAYIEKVAAAMDGFMPCTASSMGVEEMWREWVVRLGSILYFQENRPEYMPDTLTYLWCVNKMVRKDADEGFIWQFRSVDFLRHYQADRGTYRTFADFLPQLEGHLGFVAENMIDVKMEYENRHPYVTDVYPAPYTELDLSSDSVTVVFTFSEAMETQGYGFGLLCRDEGYFDRLGCGDNVYRAFWADEKRFAVNVKSEDVKNAGIYGIKISKDAVHDIFLYPMVNDFAVEWKP